MRAQSLENITTYWNRVLSNPDIAQVWNDYDALKGDPCDHGPHCDHDENPTENMLRDVLTLSRNKDGEIKPETAQTLQFLQQFAKTQIRALEKSSLPLLEAADTKSLIDELKRRLADIESVLPPEEMERLSIEARNYQRRHDGQNPGLDGKLSSFDITSIMSPEDTERLAKNAIVQERHPDKESTWFDSYKNWLDGTLSQDQSKLIEALQWKTASGHFQPGKRIVDVLDHFFGEHFKDLPSTVTTVLITKLVYDSIVFMTSVTGAHQTEIAPSKNADQTLTEISDKASASNKESFAELDALTGGADSAATLNERCMDKVNADWSSVDSLMDHTPLGNYCHWISERLQDWFAISTVTPRTIQAGQKAASEQILEKGTIAAEAYNRHHKEVSAAIDVMAFYDNTLHAVLLGIGTMHGVKLVRKHGIKKAPVQMHKSLKQQFHLACKRPMTIGGAFAGWGTFAATHQGEFFDLSAVSYALGGALIGYLVQRKKIHLAENKTFIFNLNAQPPRSDIPYVPTTSLDQKQHHYLLKAAASYIGLSATVIMANNTGMLNYQSPEALKFMADLITNSWAWTGGLASWAVFDRFDDFLYHKTFYGTGIPIGATIAAGIIGIASLLCKMPGTPYIKAVWSKATERGKKNAAVMTLATGLTLTPANNTAFDQEHDLPIISSRLPEISNIKELEPNAPT